MADNFKPNVYQKGIWNAISPGFGNVFGQFNAMSGMPNFGFPSAPGMPSMQGVLSGVDPYAINGYDVPGWGISGYKVPDASKLMPSTDWWNSLSGDIKAGAWAPFEEGNTICLKR